MAVKKRTSELGIEDFDHAAVWIASADGDGTVEPHEGVEEIPDGPDEFWVLVRGKLADGTPVCGIATAQCPPPVLTVQSLMIEDAWHTLPLTSAPHAAGENPDADRFASEIGRTPAEVFPIYVRAEVKAECTGETISQEIDFTGPVA